MQSSLTYRTNRDLFSNYYLDEHLPETEEWDEVDDDELEAAYDEIVDLYDREKSTAPKRNESQLEEKFIRPMFRKLGIPFEVEESTSRTQRRPDYGFFETENAARNAFERREEGGDFYENAVAVADAKRWGRPLDTRGSGEHERDFENPSYQIHVYLQETPARWAVLTDGKKWRLYYGPTSHRLDSYYEIDLPTVLEKGNPEDFKYFYLFFRHGAFVEDAGGDCFLDDVYDESNVFAQDLGEDLQDNIYEAIKVLSEGYLQYPGNDLDEADLDLVHDASLIYLYRLIFVLYAEAEGRDLLDTDNEIYEESYSLNSLKQEVAEELDGGDPTYRDWQDDLSSRLDELFELIDQGSGSRGIPEEDLHIPAYNGGLFRTDPDADDGPEARFLAAHTVGDAHLARVVELLTRSEQSDTGEKIFVDYSSLDVRHLGSIYEGLLEYQLHVADGPLVLEDDEYVPVDSESDTADEVVVEAGEVYLTTGSGERKATGSYYTPEYVVEYIVDETLGPLVEDIREDLVGRTTYKKGDEEAGTFADEFAERVFDLKVLDPAMGSGHFLTSAVDYLAREIIDAQERQAAQQGVETVDEDHDINWARRKVAQRCIYGVDLNPLATELAKVSLWLRTLAAEQPLAFLDHHLKTGNSLVGSDIEDVLANGDDEKADDGQLTLEQSFAHTRQQALEHVMDRFQDLLAIDNETLADAKEMEDVYDAVRDDPLYTKLLAMANVHTAERFGLDVPADADTRMAEALRSESWSDIEGQDWFKNAQAMAAEERFFHWELEFPVAFYTENGDRKANAGFDAVIGNPPYVSPENQAENIRSYLTESDRYPCTHGRFDIYLCFMDMSIYLVRNGGLTSMIIPYPHLYENYAKKFRHRQLFDLKTNRILDLSDQEVFENVGVRNIIQTLENTKTDEYKIEISHAERESKSIHNISNPVSVENSIFKDIYNNRIRVNLDRKDTEILQKVQEEIFVNDFYYTCRGVEIYSVDAGNTKRDRIHDTKQTARDKPYIEGKEVVPWTIPSPSRYIDYEPSKMKRPRFPELFENEKLLIQDVVGDNGLAVALDDTGLYCDNTINCCVKVTELDDDKMRNTNIPTGTEYEAVSEIPNECILAQWNSSLVSYYYKKLIESGLHVYPSDIGQIPVYLPSESSIESIQESELPKQSTIKNTDAGEKKLLEWLSGYTKQRIGNTHNRVKLNLNLRDYLGNYEDGPKLPDIGLFQPTASNILDATAEEYENLRVGDVRTDRDGSSVTVSATGRYKPDDEDAHDTDRWGYTETEYLEAFTLMDLTDAEAALVEAFVPVAVEEAGGFAGFRETATKTNSLIDRLKAITLPDPDDVADDLDRYVETRERAAELDAKIERTDRIIDEIVYDLYDLTDEEIRVVEEAVEE